jgi:hypothetical protein
MDGINTTGVGNGFPITNDVKTTKTLFMTWQVHTLPNCYFFKQQVPLHTKAG